MEKHLSMASFLPGKSTAFRHPLKSRGFPAKSHRTYIATSDNSSCQEYFPQNRLAARKYARLEGIVRLWISPCEDLASTRIHMLLLRLLGKIKARHTDFSES